MKLSQYDPSVNRNLSNAKVNPVTDPNAFGANTKGIESMGNVMGQVLDLRTKAWMKDQNDRVVDAENEYNRQINSLLYDENKGLTNTMQGKNAEGLQAAYQQGEEQIRRNIIQQYGLTSDYSNRAFQNHVNTSVTSNLDTIDKFQRKEMLSYATNQLTTMNENAINTIVRNPDTFDTVYGDMEKNARAIMAGTGMDETAIDVKQRSILNQTAATVLSSIAEANDYERGNNLIQKLRLKGGNESTLRKYEILFQGKKIAKTTKDGAGNFLDLHPELLDKTPEEAWEIYKKENPLQMPSRVGGTALGSIGETIAKELGWDPSWGYAIAAHESGRGESAPGNNYFGYKWDGEGDYQELKTWERDENGNAYETMAKFKKYDTPEESAMGYVNWIKTYCTPEEIKNVKSAADVVHIMKRHGYFTDHEESYAASATELAKEYSAPAPVSDEEKAAFEETEKNSFLSIYNERVKANKARQADLLEALQIQTMSMAENNASNEDVYEAIKAAGTEHPELMKSGAYRSLRLNALGAIRKEKSNGGFGTEAAQNKAFASIKARIGTDIMTDEDLNKTLGEISNKGYGFTSAQLVELSQELKKAQAGEGAYSIKVDDTIDDVAELTGLGKMEIKQTYDEAKKIVMQKAFEFKGKTGRFPNITERKAMWSDAFLQKRVGPDYGFWGMSTPEASEAELMKLGIKSADYAYDDQAIDVVDYQGRHHYIPAEDWKKIKNHEANVADY